MRHFDGNSEWSCYSFYYESGYFSVWQFVVDRHSDDDDMTDHYEYNQRLYNSNFEKGALSEALRKSNALR